MFRLTITNKSYKLGRDTIQTGVYHESNRQVLKRDNDCSWIHMGKDKTLFKFGGVLLE